MGEGVMGYLRDKFKDTNTGKKLTEREKLLRGDVEQAAATDAKAKQTPPASSADPETQKLLDKYKNLKRGAVIPGHDLTGKDDVRVNVTRGEAILPVKTVDAMGGSEAVRGLIHKTNGKPAVGARRGGKYAAGMVPEDDVLTPGGGMKKIYPGSLFKPGAGAKKLSDVTVVTDVPPVNQSVMGAEGRSVPQRVGVQKTPTTPAAAPVAAATMTQKGDATLPARDPNAPVGDQRLAALGVTSDWNKMTEAAGQPIQNAEIYSNKAGNSFAGYGTQTPEKEAADRARADAAHARMMGTYERESQARLGARVAAARLRGEDAYADSLEKQAEKQALLTATGTKAKAELAAQEGLGGLRTAQTKQTELGTEQAISKQAMTDEYLKADTTPERRKVLAATLGIKPDSGWNLVTTYGPPGPDGQPTKSTIAHRTTASGELETRDLSGGAQATAPLAVGSKANQPDGSYVAHGKTVTIKNGTVTEIK